jgi:hypothetical protein
MPGVKVMVGILNGQCLGALVMNAATTRGVCVLLVKFFLGVGILCVCFVVISE